MIPIQLGCVEINCAERMQIKRKESRARGGVGKEVIVANNIPFTIDPFNQIISFNLLELNNLHNGTNGKNII